MGSFRSPTLFLSSANSSPLSDTRTEPNGSLPVRAASAAKSTALARNARSLEEMLTRHRCRGSKFSRLDRTVSKHTACRPSSTASLLGMVGG